MAGSPIWGIGFNTGLEEGISQGRAEGYDNGKGDGRLEGAAALALVVGGIYLGRIGIKKWKNRKEAKRRMQAPESGSSPDDEIQGGPQNS